MGDPWPHLNNNEETVYVDFDIFLFCDDCHSIAHNAFSHVKDLYDVYTSDGVVLCRCDRYLKIYV